MQLIVDLRFANVNIGLHIYVMIVIQYLLMVRIISKITIMFGETIHTILMVYIEIVIIVMFVVIIRVM